jgi:mannose-6-phosphate isomerase-like protein (cupin superfamily)
MIVKRDSVDPIDFAGLRILDYTSEMDTGSSFAVITVPPRTSHAEAWSRRSDKYYYVAAGEVEFTLDGKLQVLSTGDFCVVLRGQHFSYRNLGPHEAQLHLVHTPGFDLDSEVFV